MVKRPNFEAFREMFLDSLSQIIREDPAFCSEIKWTEVGDHETRREVLEAVKEKLRENYGMQFEVNNRLLSVEGPVESVVIQTFHELNTIYLVEKINAKIRAKLN